LNKNEKIQRLGDIGSDPSTTQLGIHRKNTNQVD